MRLTHQSKKTVLQLGAKTEIKKRRKAVLTLDKKY